MPQHSEEPRQLHDMQGLSGTTFLLAVIDTPEKTGTGRSLDGMIARWSPDAEHLFGYRATDAIGQSVSLIIPGHRMKEFRNILGRIRLGERLECYEIERLTKGNEVSPTWITISPIRDSTGRVIGAAVAAKGICQPRTACVALGDAERRYQSLVETSILGIFRATLDGSFLVVNPALVRLLGYDDRDEVLSLSTSDVYVDPTALTALVAACKDHQEIRQDVAWKRRDGAQIVVRLSAHIVCSGRQETFEALAEDITVQLEFQRQLHRLERIELLGQLAGGIAHDFNNYLDIIINHETLLSRALSAPGQVQHHLIEIHKAVEHAAQLTKRLLLLGKRSPGTPEVEVSLNAAVQEAGSMLKSTLSSTVSLTLGLAAKTITMRGSPREIQQIVMNLVLNSRDAMPAGGEIRITTGCATFRVPTRTIAGDYLSGEYIVLCVADNGHGMDEATAVRALEPFFSTKPEGKGTGLGLPSVYATAKRYGGSLDIKTALGRGTVIRIYFPLAASEQIAHRVLKPIHATSTVLIVDDDGRARPVVADALASAGFKAIQAATWNEAALVVEHGSVDVLFCGLELADVSRREILERIRRWNGKVRTIVSSGEQLSEAERRQLHSGSFLQKPFSIAQLLSIIREEVETTNAPAES